MAEQYLTVSFSIPIEKRHPFTILGDMQRDSCLFRNELQRLTQDETGIHGRLQVMLGAATRQAEYCKRLLADLEGQMGAPAERKKR